MNPLSKNEPPKDISDMNWQERERIFRLMYSKVSKGVNPSYWQKLNSVMIEREKFVDDECLDHSDIDYNLIGYNDGGSSIV
jgi:hypothetical protein